MIIYTDIDIGMGVQRLTGPDPQSMLSGSINTAHILGIKPFHTTDVHIQYTLQVRLDYRHVYIP